MTQNQIIARFLLYIWNLIYQRWVKSSISVDAQTAVENRLNVLEAAVLANNVPDLTEMLKKYIKLSDGSVMRITVKPQAFWTAEDWANETATKQNSLNSEITMHQSTITALQTELTDIQGV